MKNILLFLFLALSVCINAHACEEYVDGACVNAGAGLTADSVGTSELDDASDTPSAGECVKVASDTSKIEYASCGGSNHALDSSTHTDVAAMTEATGDLLYWNGSAWTNLAAGSTSGHVLTSNGAAAAPSWQAAASGGGEFAIHSSHTTTSVSHWMSFGSGKQMNGETAPFGMDCTKLYCQVDTAPGAGKSWTIDVSGKDSGSTTCTISDTNTTCNTTSGTAHYNAGTDGGFYWTATGGPASSSDHSCALGCTAS